MNRRMFLATTGVVLATPFAGCLGSATTGSEPPDRPWPASDRIEDPNAEHHLFVANHTDTTESAWLRVVREDDTTVVDGRYELPDERGIKFENVAAWGRTYRIELAIDGNDVRTLQWQTSECQPDPEGPPGSGSRNAIVCVEGDDGSRDVSLVVDQCDAIFAPDVPTGPARNFRLDDD